MDRTRAIRVLKLHEQDEETGLEGTTAAERLEMVWPLTLQAWAFKDDTVAEQRFQRHVVSVRRGRR